MRSLKGLSLGIVVAALAGGCAAQSRSPRACEPVPAEFLLPDQVVYRDCAVDRKARVNVVSRGMAYTPAPGQTCASAEIDVVIDSTGRPVRETARVTRSTDATFAAAVINSLDGVRYSPALKDGRPVAQLVHYGQAFVVRRVAVPVGTSPASIRPPRGRPPC